MPLTKKGKRVLVNFKKRYGKQGKGVFYAYMKKHPRRVRKWHK